MEKTLKENKMGTMKIPKLLYSISVPIIISMIVQALYNIVDSIFVAIYNNDAGTGALTLAFPIQNLILAMALGLAVGTNSLLSRSLGERNHEKANTVAGQGFFLTLCGYVPFLIFGLFFLEPFIRIQTGGSGDLYQYSIDYLSIVTIGSVGVFIQVVTERLLQATGKSVYSMIIQLSGAIINIILDPILIFGWLGAPEMGVKGAAIATVIGQLASAAIGIFINLRFNKDIKLKIKNFIPKAKLLGEMLVIGIPSVLMQAIGSIMTFAMNNILLKFSQAALNVFGVYFKLQSFVFMPVFGLNNGMIPIVAFNYGAKRRDRMISTIKLALVSAVIYMFLGFLVFQFLPDTLLGFFNATAEMLEIGRPALRTISISFLLASFSVILISMFQALGKSIYSLFVSIGRQLVILIPAAYLLSLTGKLSLVWWAFPIAELIGFALSVIFSIFVIKNNFPKKEELDLQK